MKRGVGVVLTAAFGIVALAATASAQGKADEGKALFTSSKCPLCHSIADKGNKKGPLDDVGSKLKADEIRSWISDPAAMREKAKATRTPAMTKNATLTKDQIDSLVAYLATLKK